MSTSKKSLGFILIIIAAIFWSSSAIFVKQLLNENFEPLIIVQMRVSIAAILLLIFLLSTGIKNLKIEKKDILKFLFIGICGLAGSNYFYYNAFKFTTASMAILIQYTAPIFVMIYALFFHNENFTKRKYISLTISLIGIFFAVGGYKSEIFVANYKGIISAFFAAISFAIYNIGSKNILKKYNSQTVIFYTILAASIFWLCVNNPIQIMEQNYNYSQWKTFFIISVISILLPYSFYTIGLKLVSPTEAIITSTSEPIFTVIFDMIILGSTMSLLQAFGGIFVLVAIVILQIGNEN